MNDLTRTTDDFDSIPHAQNTDGQEPATRLIDVHIYDLPPQAETPDTVESTPPRPPRRPWILLCVLLVCLIAAMLAVILYVLPTLAPSTTVTIVPVSRQISTTSRITIGQTVPGRTLSAITMSQAEKGPTTGTGHQDATQAHGDVTFFNAAPYAQTIPAGTLLTGNDGVQVVTDQDATIPAGSLSTNGQATVGAHAVQSGPTGNIAASDIYGNCCRVDVLVANAAFSGGNTAQSYQAVTQQDITSASETLKTSLAQSITASAQAQIHANETLLAPILCTSTVTSNHQVGDAATQVQVTVNETCLPTAYQTVALQTVVTQQNTRASAKQLGTGYQLASDVQTSIAPASVMMQKGYMTFAVKSVGSWNYALSDASLRRLARDIAGKSKQQATAYLLQQRGIAQVSIQVGALPRNPDKIRVVAFYLA